MVVFAFDEHKDNTKRGKCQKFIRARKRDQMIRSRRTQTPFRPGASRPGRQLRSASPHPGGSGGSFRRTAVRGAVLGETASVLLLAVLAAILVGAGIIYGAEHWSKHASENKEDKDDE